VEETSKNQAYVSFLGFTKSMTKIHGLSPADLVAMANRYSASLGLAEPPVLEARTVGKMGLKGVPGLNVESGGAKGGRGGGGRGGFGGGPGRGAPGGGPGRGFGGFGGQAPGGGPPGRASARASGGFGDGAPRGGAPGGQQNKKRTFSKRE
jgi:ATP-dependent RNA helicase MSS116